MVIVSMQTYEAICKFCENFHGLTIDCEHELYKKFPHLDAQVLSAILSKEWQKIIKHRHHVISRAASNLLKE